MRILTIVITFIFITSCKKEKSTFIIRNHENEVKYVKDTSNNKILKGVNIGPIDKYGLIQDIRFFDNKLLMRDAKSDSIFIKYNLETKKIEKSFTRGEGPNQIIIPQVLKITSFANFSDIQFYDFNKGLFKVNFNKEEKISKLNLKLLDFDYRSSFQSIVMIKENVFAMTNLDPLTTFSIYNKKTKKMAIIPAIENLKIDYTINNLQKITPSDIGYNKKIKFYLLGVVS